MKRIPWWAFALAGLALGAFLWFPRGHVQTPDDDPRWQAREDSLRREHSADSAAAADRYRVALAAAESAAAVASQRAGSASHWRRVADSLRALRSQNGNDRTQSGNDSLLEQENAALRVALDTLTDAYGSLFAAYRGTIEAASAAHTGWMQAEGQLSLERTQWSDREDAWRATVNKLKRPNNSVRIGAGADAMVSGHGVTSVAGATIKARRQVWFAEVEAQATGGYGIGGNWKTGDIAPGPGASIRVDVTF